MPRIATYEKVILSSRCRTQSQLELTQDHLLLPRTSDRLNQPNQRSRRCRAMVSCAVPPRQWMPVTFSPNGSLTSRQVYGSLLKALQKRTRLLPLQSAMYCGEPRRASLFLNARETINHTLCSFAADAAAFYGAPQFR